jgi:hypothetical protein
MFTLHLSQHDIVGDVDSSLSRLIF